MDWNIKKGKVNEGFNETRSFASYSTCGRCTYFYFQAQKHRDGDLEAFSKMCILPLVNNLDIIVLIQLALKGLEFIENDGMFKEIIFYNSMVYVHALI